MLAINTLTPESGTKVLLWSYVQQDLSLRRTPTQALKKIFCSGRLPFFAGRSFARSFGSCDQKSHHFSSNVWYVSCSSSSFSSNGKSCIAFRAHRKQFRQKNLTSSLFLFLNHEYLYRKRRWSLSSQFGETRQSPRHLRHRQGWRPWSSIQKHPMIESEPCD